MRGDGAWVITLILRAPVLRVFLCIAVYVIYMCVYVCFYAYVSFSIRVESDMSGRRDLTVSSSCRMMKNRLIFSQVSIFLCIYVYIYIHIYVYTYIYIFIYIYIYTLFHIYKYIARQLSLAFSFLAFTHFRAPSSGLIRCTLSTFATRFFAFFTYSSCFPLLSFLYSFDASPRSGTHIEHGTTHTRIIIVPKSN